MALCGIISTRSSLRDGYKLPNHSMRDPLIPSYLWPLIMVTILAVTLAFLSGQAFAQVGLYPIPLDAAK